MIDKDLLDLLACPETKKPLAVVEDEVIEKANCMIEQGTLMFRTKEKVTAKLSGGLYRQGDRAFMYPVRDNVPVLLVEELIALNNLE